MFKPVLGFITGGILTGLLLIFFGSYVFPEVIHTFIIAVVIGFGFAVGLLIGFLTLKIPSFALSITWSLALGAFGFFLLALFLSGHILLSIIGGAFTGLFTGLLTFTWGTDQLQTQK